MLPAIVIARAGRWAAGGQQEGSRADNPVNALTSVIFLGSYSNLTKIFIVRRSMPVSVSLNMQMMDHFMSQPFFFQVKGIKFGRDVGLNMLLKISSRFCHNHRNFCWQFFMYFPTLCIENHHQWSHVCCFSQIIFKPGEDIFCSNISNKHSVVHFLVKTIKFDPNVGINMFTWETNITVH